MKTRIATTIIAVSVMLAGAQVLASLAGSIGGIVCGILLPLMSLYLLRFFHLGSERPWMNLLIPAWASLGGVFLVVVSTRALWNNPLWFSPGCAIVSSIVSNAVIARSSRRCGLCNTNIAGEVSFSCPRCHLPVCEKSCWVFERLRCKLCERNQVPLPWRGQQWWTSHFGGVSRHGRCEYCKRAAEPSESSPSAPSLRPCQQCGRFHCEECWDYLNCQCSRCGWTVEDLPPELQTLMTHPDAMSSASNSQRSRHA